MENRRGQNEINLQVISHYLANNGGAGSKVCGFICSERTTPLPDLHRCWLKKSGVLRQPEVFRVYRMVISTKPLRSRPKGVRVYRRVNSLILKTKQLRNQVLEL